MRNNHQILYQDEGFILRIPTLNSNDFIRWNSINTIVFDPHAARGDGVYYWQRYVLFLNTLPHNFLDENAVWINRFMKCLSPGPNKRDIRINITDENPDFKTFRRQAAQHLGFSESPEPGLLNKEDWIIKKEETTIDVRGRRTTTTHAQPQNRGMAAPYQVLYDRWGRTIEAVYEQHRSI